MVDPGINKFGFRVSKNTLMIRILELLIEMLCFSLRRQVKDIKGKKV